MAAGGASVIGTNGIAYLTEFFGAVIFFTVILVTGNPLLIGATLAVLILLAGPISGGHFNPGVSIMMFLNKTLSGMDMLSYILMHILAGYVALQMAVLLKQSSASSS